jgi:hypothetical protein
MTEQLRQQLKALLSTFVEQKIELEMCVDKIVELFQEKDEIHLTTYQQQGRRRSSIFDGILMVPSADALQRRRSSTYNEQGLVNNFNTVLHDNRDID